MFGLEFAFYGHFEEITPERREALFTKLDCVGEVVQEEVLAIVLEAELVSGKIGARPSESECV